jgi:hypothetical protein
MRRHTPGRSRIGLRGVSVARAGDGGGRWNGRRLSRMPEPAGRRGRTCPPDIGRDLPWRRLVERSVALARTGTGGGPGWACCGCGSWTVGGACRLCPERHGGRSGARPDRPRELPSPSRAGRTVPSARAAGAASPRHRDAVPYPSFRDRAPLGASIQDRVIRLAINVPSHSESTAR